MSLPKLDYKWVVLAVTTVGMFMASLDASILIIGLPNVLQDLDATMAHGVWIITGYRLMMVILMVLFGRLADLHGKVRLYNIGFAVFTVGSLACGLSKNGEQLVAFRILQGGGAALLAANSAAIITDAFPRGQLGKAAGTNMMADNLGSIAGFTLSGVMIAFFGWRSIFLVNVPIGIFGTIWSYKRLKEVGVRSAGETFDWAGSILYCVALMIILWALTIGDPLSPRNLAITGCGLVLFVAVILVERKQKCPTLDLRLFRIRMFAAGNITSFLNSLAFHSGPFLRSLYLQLVLGYSPLKTGLMLIPLEIMVFVFSPITGRLADKYGSRVLTSSGLALNAMALFWFATLNQRSSYGSVLVSLILFGLGRALFASPNLSAVMGSVPAERRGVANGVRSTVAKTGGVLSVPFSLLLMSIAMPYSRLSQIVGGNELSNPGEVSSFMHAVNFACLVLGVVMLLAIIPSLMRGPQEAPDEVGAPAQAS